MKCTLPRQRLYGLDTTTEFQALSRGSLHKSMLRPIIQRAAALRLSGPYLRIQFFACPMSLGLLASDVKLHLSSTQALQWWALRVRFDLTLTPELFSPQKLTQSEFPSVWPVLNTCLTTASSCAPARAVITARGALRRNHPALPCGRLRYNVQ